MARTETLQLTDCELLDSLRCFPDDVLSVGVFRELTQRGPKIQDEVLQRLDKAVSQAGISTVRLANKPKSGRPMNEYATGRLIFMIYAVAGRLYEFNQVSPPSMVKPVARILRCGSLFLRRRRFRASAL